MKGQTKKHKLPLNPSRNMWDKALLPLSGIFHGVCFVF